MFDITSLLSPILGNVIDRVFPDKTKADKIRLEMLTAELNAELQPMIRQLEVNAKEAAHASRFVSGWRPFIGWTCGLAFAYQYVVLPVIILLFSIAGQQLTLPHFDFATMSAVLFGMLGLGGLRTYEKFKGVTR